MWILELYIKGFIISIKRFLKKKFRGRQVSAFLNIGE